MLESSTTSGAGGAPGLNSPAVSGAGSVDPRTTGLNAQSRTLRNSVFSLIAFFLLVGALLLGVPGLQSVTDRIEDANLAWVSVAVGLELLSCAGYVVLFELVFNNLDRHLTSRLSLSELAVNSVVSASGVGGIALGAWVLRSKGVSVERIAKRSVLIFALTSAVNVGAVAAIGLPMWIGVLPGSRDPLLTLLPAVVAIGAIVGTLGLAAWARRVAQRSPLEHGRKAVALAALAGGVEDAVELIRHPDWRLLGAVGYWLFDNLALYACLAAYGHVPVVWAVLMAYLVGLLANSIPIPGGFGVVEGGLVGMLVLFDARPASLALAAVLTFRAISLWIPSIIGIFAFLSLRRELGEPLSATVESPAAP
ncbi:MAG TPA: lysylphosphatidylglycerol synthase transmembrane domain-containing protein [Solirubrobacteraceae bacterium]|nr:lysylphosphatidylglycerol synthase transmembrane domain-containing protein [Solirubrobacteraceae bacterium]